MNRIISIYTLVLLACLLLCRCKKPYEPPATGAAAPDHLVVEGNINPGSDSTIIHLTHTLPLSAPSGTLPTPELNATVSVESNANSYPLAAIGNGYYIATGLNLNAANNYRLKIVTSNNKTYESDYVPVKNSPAIDSVSFNIQTTGLQVNVSTHDATNNSRYYRYEFEETWIIHANYFSGLELIKGVNPETGGPTDSIDLRYPNHQIFQCWSSDKSSSIVLGSTDKLSKDVLLNSPVAFIDSHSEKIGQRYSILVKQYTVTKEAFEYYQLLSKNTEKIGSIFDPQPSNLTGNIHNVADPSEQVIGYITAGAFTHQRVFINKLDLPGTLQYHTTLPYDNCFTDSLYYSNPRTGENQVKNYIYTGGEIPLTTIQKPGGKVLGYVASEGICVDCTLRGTNVKPSFWIDQ